jgi:hypothetical protein
MMEGCCLMFAKADAIHLPLADRSVDLVIGSPPYGDKRLYLEGGPESQDRSRLPSHRRYRPAEFSVWAFDEPPPLGAGCEGAA